MVKLTWELVMKRDVAVCRMDQGLVGRSLIPGIKIGCVDWHSALYYCTHFSPEHLTVRYE